MKRLATITYYFSHKPSYTNYKLDELNIEIEDLDLIRDYRDDIENCEVKFEFDSENNINLSVRDSKTDTYCFKSKPISKNLFNNGTIGDFVNPKIPTVFNKDSICKEIVNNNDDTYTFLKDGNTKYIGVQVSNDNIIVYHPSSDTIFEYNPKNNPIHPNSINLYDEFESKHIFIDNGIISEFYNDKGELQQDTRIYNNDKIYHCKSEDKNDMFYDYIDSDINLFYLSNYIMYVEDLFTDADNEKIDVNSNTKVSYPEYIIFDTMTDNDKNYAGIVPDFDIIIDPLFPQQSLKGNRMRISRLYIDGSNLYDIKHRKCGIMLEAILYKEEK